MKTHSSKEAATMLSKAITESGLAYRDYYREVYLQSDHWHELRQQLKEERGNTCEHCGRVGNMDCHHLQYRSLFDVTTDDLLLLCRDCHEEEHRIAPDIHGLPARWRAAFRDEWQGALDSGARGADASLVAIRSLLTRPKAGNDEALRLIFTRMLTEWNKENIRQRGVKPAKRKKPKRKTKRKKLKKSAQRNLEHLAERGRL